MTKFRQRKLWFALLAFLFVFAACKGESPTAPPVGGGNPPTGGGGGGTTPSGFGIVLSASPESVEVDSTSVITATVTLNNAPVADGTAVEFTTTNGTFADTGANTTIRTTTGGVAKASLTSTTAGNAVVSATVNNVTRTTQVTFGAKQLSIGIVATPADPEAGQATTIIATLSHSGAPVPNGTQVEFTTTSGTFAESGTASTVRTTIDGVARATLTSSTPGLTTVTVTSSGVARTAQVNYRTSAASLRPTITGINPSFGNPQGGETIKIAGTNFRGRVRVFFDIGEVQPREAMVVSMTATELTVITPPVNLAPGQQLQAPITVVVDADTADEARTTSATPFSFRSTQLTPNIVTVTPNSGPPQGGTIVTIFGSNFEETVQVLFGQAEARVIESHFDNIKVQAPAARDTTGTGAEPATGIVPVTVVNIKSGTRTNLASGFRYTPGMSITAISPNQGPYTGGTRITIDGVGFDDPVAVSVAGYAAQVIDARSGTKLIVESSAIDITSCGNITGPVVVTNIETGISATGPTFTYRVPKPTVLTVNPSTAVEGSSVVVTVANAQPGTNRIKLGDKVVFPTSATFNPDGTANFTVVVPTTIQFTTRACTVGSVTGVQNVPAVLDVTYTNVVTTCTDTADDALTVNPTNATCVIPDPPNAAILPTTPPCQAVAGVAALGTGTASTSFTVRNTGGQPLAISLVSVSSSTNATITVTPSSATVAPQGSQTFTVTADPAAAGAFGGTLTVNSNDPDTPALTFCFSGNAT